MTYKVMKYNTKEDKMYDYCNTNTEEDVKVLTRGYKKTDKVCGWQYYQRKGSSIVWAVMEEK